MDAKITLSFDAEVITKAKEFAAQNGISLSRLTEFIFAQMTSQNYKTIDELPIADWVNSVADERPEYGIHKSRKKLKSEFYKSKKVKIFVDANILVTVLNSEYPLFPSAARILSLNQSKKFRIYTSPICLAIAFYFAEKKSGTQRAKEKIKILSQQLEITNTNKKTVRMTSENPKINDFENGLEYYSAIESGCEMIVTEDTADFYFSEIQVLNCDSFISYLGNR